MQRLRVLGPWISTLLAVACRADAPTGESSMLATDGASSGSMGETDPPIADACENALPMGEETVRGTLRNAVETFGGACRGGGPEVFYALDVPFRVDVEFEAEGEGFDPIVELASPECIDAASLRGWACTEPGGSAMLRDVDRGSRLLVVVGIAPEDPALASEVPEEGRDPLEFVVRAIFTEVLSTGALCEPQGRGRCEAGSVCAGDPDDPSAPATCIAVSADTCATAETVSLGQGITTLDVDLGLPQSDDHAHSCGGDERRDRVYELRLPEDLDPFTNLLVRTSAPDVVLALRDAECSPAGELACDDGGSLRLDAVATRAPAGASLFLFVELPPPSSDPEIPSPDAPDDSGELSQLQIEVELTPDA